MANSDVKININPETSKLLKDFRNKYNVKAKSLSEYLGKSAAYISKLENGQIKHIAKSDLSKILDFITKSDNGYSVFIEEVSESLDIQSLEYSLFISNFDWIERIIPIPIDYCKYVKNKIESLHITVSELTEYINLNEDLEDTFFSEHKIQKNEIANNIWHTYYEADSHSTQRHFIIINVNKELIENIIYEKETKTCYLHLFSILYHLYKLEMKQNKPYLDEKDKQKAKDNTSKYLQKNKIYTIVEKRRAMVKAANDITPEHYLNIYDMQNMSLIKDLNEGLLILSEKDIEYVNSKLELMTNNLKIFNSFALAYMALDLKSLESTSNTLKKEFLLSVQELIKKYSAIQDEAIEKF